jgi:hypothetical protein
VDSAERAPKRRAGVEQASAPGRSQHHAGSAAWARAPGRPRRHAKVQIRPRRPHSGEQGRCARALPVGHGPRCSQSEVPTGHKATWWCGSGRGGPGVVSRSDTAMGAVGKRGRPGGIADKVPPSPRILFPLSSFSHPVYEPYLLIPHLPSSCFS